MRSNIWCWRSPCEPCAPRSRITQISSMVWQSVVCDMYRKIHRRSTFYQNMQIYPNPGRMQRQNEKFVIWATMTRIQSAMEGLSHCPWFALEPDVFFQRTTEANLKRSFEDHNPGFLAAVREKQRRLNEISQKPTKLSRRERRARRDEVYSASPRQATLTDLP